MYCAWRPRNSIGRLTALLITYFRCSIRFALKAKEELDDGGYYSDKKAGGGPGCDCLLGVVMAAQHFDIDVDCTGNRYDAADSVHELDRGGEVAADEGISLIDACIAVGGALSSGGGDRKSTRLNSS